MASIAQLGERKTEDLKVTGSIAARNPGSWHCFMEFFKDFFLYFAKNLIKLQLYFCMFSLKYFLFYCLYRVRSYKLVNRLFSGKGRLIT